MSTLLVRSAMVGGRLAAALRRHWLAIMLGSATGIYVAFAGCLALIMVWVAHDVRLADYELALVMDAFLLVGSVGGGFVGYVRRRSR